MNVPGRPALRHKQNEQVSCGVCKEVLRYDGLPCHFKRKHKDSDPFVYGEDSSKKQKTLSGFLFSNSKASQQTVNKGEEFSKPTYIKLRKKIM